jgi:hypothetical protein
MSFYNIISANHFMIRIEIFNGGKSLRSSPRSAGLRALRMASKPGISFAEYMIAFAIFAIISMTAAGIYLAHFRLFTNQNTAIDVNTQGKMALDDITNQLRQSETIVATCASCGADTTGTTTLILRLWPIDASLEPIDPAGANYDYILYKRNPGNTSQLIRITYPYATSTRKPGTHVVAINIGNLQFTYDNATPSQAAQVTVTVTTTATAGGKTQTFTDSAKADLRNK